MKNIRIMVALAAIGLLILPTSNAQTMTTTENQKEDLAILRELNARFIRNFVKQDVRSHNEIIHKDFVCIQGSGVVVGRDEYLKDWANGYTAAGYQTFDYTDEFIRIFGNTALIRSKTVYTKLDNGTTLAGASIYTDTYIKENGRWLCVQAQITPVKQ